MCNDFSAKENLQNTIVNHLIITSQKSVVVGTGAPSSCISLIMEVFICQ
jgi:hypothetical protein